MTFTADEQRTFQCNTYLRTVTLDIVFTLAITRTTDTDRTSTHYGRCRGTEALMLQMKIGVNFPTPMRNT